MNLRLFCRGLESVYSEEGQDVYLYNIDRLLLLDALCEKYTMEEILSAYGIDSLEDLKEWIDAKDIKLKEKN